MSSPFFSFFRKNAFFLRAYTRTRLNNDTMGCILYWKLIKAMNPASGLPGRTSWRPKCPKTNSPPRQTHPKPLRKLPWKTPRPPRRKPPRNPLRSGSRSRPAPSTTNPAWTARSRRSPRTATPKTIPRTRSPFSTAWRPSASVPACTSATRPSAACTTWSMKSSTTVSTKRSPDSPRRSP